MARIGICGVGAIGSWLAGHLATLPDIELILLDDDRVERQNLAVGLFTTYQLGVAKATAVSEFVHYRGGVATPVVRRLERAEDILRHNPDLVVDAFDNYESRAFLCSLPVPVLHAGVSADRTGSARWDDLFQLPDGPLPPRGVAADGGNPVCTHILGRRILSVASTVSAAIIEEWLETDEKRSALFFEDGRVLYI